MALTPLTKKTYVPQTTPTSSSNLNDIQDAVIEMQGKVLITDSQSLTDSEKENVKANIGLDGKNTTIKAADCVNIQTPADINASVCKAGNVCVLRLITGVRPASTASGWVQMFTLPYTPLYRFNFVIMNDTDGVIAEARVDNTGGFYIYNPVAGKNYWGEGVYIC